MTILEKFNFSYSTYETYLKSPLWFYFMKILNAQETDPGMQVYGNAGNVVHNAGQEYWDNKLDVFREQWIAYDIAEQKGFKGTLLSYDLFNEMFKRLQNYMDNEIKCETSVSELKIEKEFFGMNFKGFVDLYTETKDGIIIYDWKTNSKHDRLTHISQRFIYSWLIWKIKGKIPLCRWVYLRDMDIIEDQFTEQELQFFEKHDILKFKQEILEKGFDIANYSGGDWRNPFNKYYTLCREEVEKRQSQQYMEVHMAIKGNFVFFEGDISSKLEEGIDFKTRFDLPTKYHMQEAIRKKARGRVNLVDVGTVHLYNKKFKCFPIGLLDPITKICREYATHFNKEMKIFLNDKRDPGYLNRTIEGMPEGLITDKSLWDFQTEAVQAFLAKKSGIINIATGGGKTLIAAEIIRQCKAKTLWIIDREEILEQTKDVLEELLGVEVGVIYKGKVVLKDITIATVQSLNSKLANLKDYLYTVNFVCVDEYHKSAAETFQKVFAKIPNTKYRLGLTATVARDDGKAPILYSILSEIVYKKSTKELIDAGYLMKPDITFYKLKGYDLFSKKYPEDYKFNVEENDERNKLIISMCQAFRKNKILILTKHVNHGKALRASIFGSDHIHSQAQNRKQIMEKFRYNKLKVLIMTTSIGAEGLDIPDLDVIINAGANKGDVKSRQIIGRILRICLTKTKARYIDFVDIGKYTKEHSRLRIKTFEDEGHEVKIK